MSFKSEFISKWTPENTIALVIVLGCLALLFTGIDGEVKGILGVAAGWVFRAGTMRNIH